MEEIFAQNASAYKDNQQEKLDDFDYCELDGGISREPNLNQLNQSASKGNNSTKSSEEDQKKM